MLRVASINISGLIYNDESWDCWPFYKHQVSPVFLFSKYKWGSEYPNNTLSQSNHPANLSTESARSIASSRIWLLGPYSKHWQSIIWLPDHRISHLAREKACPLKQLPAFITVHGQSWLLCTRMKKPSSKPSSLSTFLLLPLEIRLLIYTHLLGDRTIHIGSLTHNVDKPGKMLCRERHCRKFKVARQLSIFLATKNGWCWGQLYHRVCNTKTFCIDSMDQQMLTQLDSELYRDEEFTGPDLYAPHYWCTHEPAQTALDLRILRTCRQVYEEARLIPYHTNTFAFDSPWVMVRFCMRSIQVTKHPRNKNHTPEEFKPRSKKRFFFRNGSAEPEAKEMALIPISEIRNLQIHATWRKNEDYYDWDTICLHTAHLWTGLQSLHLSVDVLPEGGTYRDQWMLPDSASGFRAYRKSPLRTVSVDVSDKYRHLFCTRYPFGREKAHYWSTKAQKKEFEDGIRDYLLTEFEPGLMPVCWSLSGGCSPMLGDG